MESLHENPFRGCTSLEWVDFSKTTKIKTLQNSAFNGCTSLKGVCLPYSITQMDIGCINMGPVYLPANLIKFGTSVQWNTFQGGENGNGTKYTKMFLTNEKFDNPDDGNKDIMLAMGAYVAVTDGETTVYSYMQSEPPEENEKYCFVSYNDIISKP